MKKKSVLFSVIAIWALIMSCNMPFGVPVPPESTPFTETPSIVPSDSSNSTGSITETPSPVPLTFTPIVSIITATPVSTETPCFPNVVAITAVNVRAGPGISYEITGGLSQSQSAKITGKNVDGTWWYIEYSGGYGWVGGTVVIASCVPASLVVIPAPPTSTPTPTNVPAAFAVVKVNYTVTTWGDASHTNCPRINAKIKVNGPGIVTYHWTRSDGASGASSNLVFAGAGSQVVTADWALGSVWAPAPDEWMGIYIDSPNHQDFGHANMPACTAP